MNAPIFEHLDAPFDLYQRYRLTADIARALAGGGLVRVLDVGGSHGDVWGRVHRPMAEFLPEQRSFSLDVAEAALAHYVRGRGDALPFRDRTFDLVCSLDVLEHVPPACRPGMLAQVLRVSSRAVVIAAPFYSAELARAEALVSDFIQRTCGYEQGQLREHREYGWPDLAATAGALAAHGWTVRVFPYGSLWQWMLMMIDKHAVQALAGGRHLELRMDRAYNELSFGNDRALPCYRHFLLAAKRPDDPVLAWAAREVRATTIEALTAMPAPATDVTACLFDAIIVHARNQELQVRLEPFRREAHVAEVEAHRQQAFAALSAVERENARLAALLRAVERSPSYRVAAWLRRLLRRKP